MGIWRVWNAGSEPGLPLVSHFSPRTGISADQTLKINFRKSPGSSLTGGWILVNSTVDALNACYMAYGGGSTLYLLNDTNTGIAGSIQLTGSLGPPISNSQCVVVSGLVSTSGDNTEVTVNVSFTESFTGTRLIFGGITDTVGNSPGWQPVGILKFPSDGIGPPAVSGISVYAPSSTQLLGYANCKNNNDQIIPACPMRVAAGPYFNTNGHFHNANRPATLVSTSPSGPFSALIDVTTDALTGLVPIYGQTTQIGQFERVSACPTGGLYPCGGVDYLVGYNDIYWVSERDQWIHIGGNTTGHGGNEYNHWMRSVPAYAILATATQFLAANPAQGKIAVNDMSLPFGGRFDIQANNRWAGSHFNHSLGKAVDVRGNSGLYTIPPQLLEQFRLLCLSNGASLALIEDQFNTNGNRHIHCEF